MAVPFRDNFIFIPDWQVVFLYASLTVAGLIALYLFYRRFRVYGLRETWRGIRKAAKANLGTFVQGGLLQRKIVQRAQGGIIHVLIFYGTLALFIGTTLVFLDSDLLKPFGIKLLQGDFYLCFKLFLDVFGVFFVAGVLYALFRRMALRPSYQHSTKGDYVILLGLLYMGVSGFILEGIRLALTDVPWARWSVVGYPLSLILAPYVTNVQLTIDVYRSLWMAHSLVAFAMVASIPYSTLYHIPAAGVNMLVARRKPLGEMDTPFNLQKMMETGNFDVKVGIDRAEDIPWNRKVMLDSCTNCGRCEAVCPANAAGRPLSPRKLVQDVDEFMLAQTAARTQQGAFESGAVNDDELWSCTSCNACVYECPVYINQLDFIMDFRRSVVAANRLDDYKNRLLLNEATYSNPYGLPSSDRDSALAEIGGRGYKEGEQFEYVYWLGCAASFDARARRIAKSVVRILEAAGVSYVMLGSREKCTGDPIRRLGEEGRFQELALQNIEMLKSVGAKKIVTHCPHCFNTLKNEYPELGGEFEVLHHSDLIAKLVMEKRLTLSKPLNLRATLHDACFVARGNGMVDEPREAVRAVPGLKLVEMKDSGRRTFCCGAGGANYWYKVNEKKPISKIRLGQALSTGAEVLTVECPFCTVMLEDAAKAEGVEEKLAVKDIAELVAESI
ncbi:MAG TPA: heterodisulfide reductase-related iron-sulfur binding cluster [Conexivisphaerales archaeon]|nr:heterodisulfide reductase-related iron-sulfur binding cluster [Conexivisphaerales archaeon]